MLPNDEFPKLMGQVEVDETFIDGNDRNCHWDNSSTWSKSTALLSHISVLGLDDTTCDWHCRLSFIVTILSLPYHSGYTVVFISSSAAFILGSQ
jgi:hypothetical protein